MKILIYIAMYLVKPTLYTLMILSTIGAIIIISKSQWEKKTMSDEYRKFREMVKAIGRVKAAEIYNKEVVKTAEYKKWKKMMNDKHGDNKDV
jgi:hypothetical protein